MTTAADNLAKARAAKRFAAPRRSITHTVKAKGRLVDGHYTRETRTIPHYTKGLAVKIMCTECLGWETHPKDCTSPLCPLFPFRDITRLTLHGNKEIT